MKRIGLTTHEKDFIKEQVRSTLGIKRRPNQQVSQLWNDLIKQLNTSKNSRRRFRSLKSALKTLKIGTRVKELDIKTNEESIKPFTYDKLIVGEHPDAVGEDVRLNHAIESNINA